jgi:hypothetical protein
MARLIRATGNGGTRRSLVPALSLAGTYRSRLPQEACYSLKQLLLWADLSIRPSLTLVTTLGYSHHVFLHRWSSRHERCWL